jgi:hypothetical protein
MSYQSIHISTQDELLQQRVEAAALKESYAGGPEFSDSAFAAQLQRNPMLALNYFMWPICIDNEADYAYALDTEGGAEPGSAEVISDAKLQAGVQTYWPKDAVTIPQPELFPDQSLPEE